ncbi:NADPH:quinone oxidoreductase 2 [Zopfochytrium polystomum]|nr:NADPH:quinone oxidoreductase 2 [Zopfochytrium polystomum]
MAPRDNVIAKIWVALSPNNQQPTTNNQQPQLQSKQKTPQTPPSATVSGTLAAALAGVKTLILISSGDIFGDRSLQHKNAVDAAKAASVNAILYTSGLRAPNVELTLAEEHKATEECIAGSGLKHIFLRNGWYLDNWTGRADQFILQGKILNAVGGTKVSAATRADYAEAAVAAALLAHEGKLAKTAHELCGEAFTLEELAAEISLRAGKTVKSEVVSEEELCRQLKGYGLPERLVHLTAATDAEVSKGALYGETTDLVSLIGRQPYNWKQHVKEVVEALPLA